MKTKRIIVLKLVRIMYIFVCKREKKDKTEELGLQTYVSCEFTCISLREFSRLPRFPRIINIGVRFH